MTEIKKIEKYPLMAKYLTSISPLQNRKFVGRDKEINLLLATLNRREVSNAALVGEPGTGKTTIVYGAVSRDKGREYYEVQTSLLSASDGGYDGSVEMGSRLTRLVREVEMYQKEHNKELVLFIDEFHVIMEVSDSAMEALKPILSNSGTRNIKLIIATTNKEYSDFVRKNAALNERLERITISEFSNDMTLRVLRSMYQSYLPDLSVDEQLLHQIITVTNRAVPSQKQPRKSIRLLDAMIGWHDTFNTPISIDLLYFIVEQTLGVNLNYRVNVLKMRDQMNNRVFDQTLAVEAVTDQVYLSAAKLRNDSKTRGGLLFTGPTGVGKTQLAKETAKHLFGSEDSMIRFDMSEFSRGRKGSVEILQRGLTRAVTDRAESLILCDEIEKGDPECIRLFLQVLDDARLTDENGLEVSFKDVYVIFTTNEGANVYESVQQSSHVGLQGTKNQTDDDLMRKQRSLLKEYDKLIRRTLQSDAAGNHGFPVELLGRLDKIVPFSPLAESTRKKIFEFSMKELSQKVYDEYGSKLHVDNRVLRFIVEEGVGSNSTKNGGGREVMKRIDDHITTKLSRFVLDYPSVKDIAVTVGGTMSIEDKYDAQGDAYIEVGAWSLSKSKQ